jgi:hypothetical protein
MLELMNLEALRVGSARRHEVALETMRDARRAASLRHATGVALVAMGRRVSGDAPVAAAKLQPAGDCI